ncbi:armadillo-type protein, partial [Coniochaeta sp. 2T2.1]
MAPRRSAPVEDAAEEEQHDQANEGAVTLQFNEPLSWRPGKPIPTDQLLKRLDRLSKELGELDQEYVDANSLLKVSNQLVSHQLLTHKDKGVRAYAACCLVDILRLCAPNAPFSQTQLKDIFSLCINSNIPSLFDTNNPYNNQHKYVLISFAEVRSIVLLQDLEGSDTLLIQLFSTIFDGVSGSKSKARVTKDVEFSMQEVLGHLVEEAGSLPAEVIDVIMAQFLRAAAPGQRHDHVPIDDNQATLLLREEPEGYQIAKNICHLYPEKMSRFVSQYFSDVIMDATNFAGRANGHKDGADSDDEKGPVGPSEGDLKELRKAHSLIRELWRAAPMILQNVVPQIDAELSADNVELRLLATETLGDMISGIGVAGPPPPPILDPAAYPPLRLDSEPVDGTVANVLTTPLSTQSFSQTHPVVYHNFISRKNDKTAAIRAAWTIVVGHILSTSAGGIGLSREEESVLLQGLSEKLNDSDEKVRLAAVKAIESFKFRDIILQLALNGGVSKEGSVLSNLADRCRDKRAPVRVQAMTLLAKLWGVGSGELLAGNEAVSAALSAIPSRIFNVFYANDPDLNALLDIAIYESLVPISFPPQPKKSAKGANGASQSQSAVSSGFDQDAIRAERILLLARSLDSAAKKAFFALQARQPQFSNIVETFIKQCELFNGGVMDNNADKKTENLNKTIVYLSRFLADPVKTKSDLLKFAKANDRRNYHLLRYVIGQEHDFKTVHKALKELTKRIQASKEPSLFDTLLPLLYRSGCFMFNRSHLPTFMDCSKSDKDGLGSIAHEVLNEISQRNPELFKAHIGDLCKDLVDQAPTATEANDPSVVDSLKACASYSRKFPREVPMDRSFIQTMTSYALYGQPPKAAKYAVHVLLSKKDSKSQTSAADLLQKAIKDWEYGGPNFLNKLYILSQLELLAPKVMEDADEKVLNICVQQLLLEVRADASEHDPKWVDDADLDDECKAKCLAMKILVNRLRSMEDVESAQASTKATWKLLKSLITKRGELCKTKDTPNHHKSRLRLVAAKLILKLCTQKHFDDQLTAADFDQLAWITQDDVMEVRHAFISKLQKYLAEGKLKARYYTIVFLTAFEPKADFKHRVETWIRSRASHFQEAKQPVMEATMPRLLSLLAHHPDYSPDLEDLVDHARYLVYYTSLVATEANLGLIYKYAERVKQTKDAVYPEWDNHRVLSDLAQAVIRKWQERKNWTFEAYPGKIGLPVGLYVALHSHDEAQEVAEKQYVPEGIDEKLDELLRAIDRKKKRKSIDDHVAPPAAKRAKPAQKSTSAKEAKEPRPTKPAARKQATPRPKKTPSKPMPPALDDTERRRSARSRKSDTKYVEPDTDEDEQEMLE